MELAIAMLPLLPALCRAHIHSKSRFRHGEILLENRSTPTKVLDQM